jgi:uncharacterized protein
MTTPHSPLDRRTWLLGGIAAAATGLSPVVRAQTAPAAKAAAGTHTEIRWDDLVPKGWDPMKGMGGDSLSLLNDADPKAQDALAKLRASWDNAPTVAALDGRAIKLPGYLVPLDETKAGLTEFLLVPYFGACIHTPPPPANQIVLVLPATPLQGFRSMDTVWVRGTLRTARTGSPMGTSAYRLEAALIDRYVTPTR